jgi:hypothetical protein
MLFAEYSTVNPFTLSTEGGSSATSAMWLPKNVILIFQFSCSQQLSLDLFKLDNCLLDRFLQFSFDSLHAWIRLKTGSKIASEAQFRPMARTVQRRPSEAEPHLQLM